MYHKYSEFCKNANMIENVPGFVDYSSLPSSNEVFYFQASTTEQPNVSTEPNVSIESNVSIEPSVSREVAVEKIPVESKQDSQKEMLPVLDTKFNLREICKQCILCEDHLSHEEKSCRDCIMKHFLALEGLAEEAVTLDRDASYPHIVTLPTELRHIQKTWYTGEKNAHECSQSLRRIRKRLMESSFPVIFESSCSSGACGIK